MLIFKSLPKKQFGLTLVEMMIALVLGLFVTGIIITVFSTNVRSNTENLKMIRLNQELRAVMSLMTDELRRAGYSYDPSEDDFMDNFQVVGGNCVLYAFDTDADGIVDDDERRGFKLNGNQIQWKVTHASQPANPAADCDDGSWQVITASDIADIATLDFDISGSVNSNGETGLNALTTSNGVTIIDVDITLVGQIDLPHTANPAKRTMFENVRMRNEAPK